MIHFNVPPNTGRETAYIEKAIKNHKICGDGEFTKKCSEWIEKRFHTQKALLTASCTSALEMAALLCELNPGDEVILPSYTFSSTATAFVLARARLVFTDIRPDTMNIDETRIEDAVTDRTKVICVMHYAGVSCEMDTVMDIARRHHLKVVEDAAQGIMSEYKGRALGTIGDFGTFSFHETKNYSMGEGGALLVKEPQNNVRAEILREKGTNRSQFYRGETAKYNWMDYGSSYLPSDILAAHLWAQLEMADKINADRLSVWNRYLKHFSKWRDKGLVELPVIPAGCRHNAHMFYLKFKNLETRTAFIEHMKRNGILTVFHYVPLHSAPAGIKYGRFHGEDIYTTKESDRLVRLPLYYHLTDQDFERITDTADAFLGRL